MPTPEIIAAACRYAALNLYICEDHDWYWRRNAAGALCWGHGGVISAYDLTRIGRWWLAHEHDNPFAKDKPMFLDNIMAVLRNPQERTAIRAKAFHLLPIGPKCATTAHLVYFRAKGVDIAPLRFKWRDKQGVIHGDIWAGTDTLDRQLRANGWLETRDMAQLKPGYYLFSQDRSGRKGAPDHVYIFCGWADIFSSGEQHTSRDAMIFDNNSANITRRNLGPGPRTPFEYALYPPV